MHTHQLVYIGKLKGEHGGDYPLRWCRVCGTLVEEMGESIAELTPQGVATGLPLQYTVATARDYSPRTAYPKADTRNGVLGRTLRDLAAGPRMLKLPGAET